MTSRPLLSVFDLQGNKSSETPLPAVFTAPIRPDIVQHVHTAMNKNHRQAYAVNIKAGKKVVASSWGTGRAVARIPRVGGGGTSRSGQGAFGNMCRGGRMFAPTKTWRKWNVKSNIKEKQFAVVSALAASAVPALVQARGHVIDDVPEVPLVVETAIESTTKTSAAKTILVALGAYDDVAKAAASKQVRSGKGKMRNRRYTMRRGPLVIYKDDESKAFRNLPGVELCCVSRLNLLQLAPGGHLGRFCIWSQAAVDELNALYGGSDKAGKNIPHASMINADIARIINSDEIQSILNAPKDGQKEYAPKRNAIQHNDALAVLDPYAAKKRTEAPTPKIDSQRVRKQQRRAHKKQGRTFYQNVSAQGDVCADGFIIE